MSGRVRVHAPACEFTGHGTPVGRPKVREFPPSSARAPAQGKEVLHTEFPLIGRPLTQYLNQMT